ncbi:MAG: (d)CMP kinase [Spirochaetia bacterium]|nr:(d)CMP kinase [Spirochaetia bacterium]
MIEMPVITMDGHAGSGKSTLAKELAKMYGFYQIDSGALYRTYTYFILKYLNENNENEIISEEIFQREEINNLIKNLKINIEFINNLQITMVNNENIEEYIRTPRISENIKAVADNINTRNMVNDTLRNLAGKYPIVADGRDMGTVVFYDADIKFFVTASAEERAKRRFLEFKEKHPHITIDEVVDQIVTRDKDDEKRPVGALKPAKDAIFIDTTGKNIKQVIENIIRYLQGSTSLRIKNFLENISKA